MKKYILAIILILFLSFNLCAINIDIPQVLKDIGYKSEDLIDYSKKYDEEYFTLANWQTKDATDTITFVVVDGKIVNWIVK